MQVQVNKRWCFQHPPYHVCYYNISLAREQPTRSFKVNLITQVQCKISLFGHIAFIFCTEISIVLNMGNISNKKKYQYSLTKPKLNSFVKLSKTCHSYDVTQNIKNGQFILCRICTTLTLSYLAVNWCQVKQKIFEVFYQQAVAVNYVTSQFQVGKKHNFLSAKGTKKFIFNSDKNFQFQINFCCKSVVL